MFLKKRTCVSEPAFHRYSTQNRCFWIIHKIHSKKPLLQSVFTQAAVLGVWSFINKTLTQVLSCEIYKLFKNNYFEEHLRASASKNYLKKTRRQVLSCEFCELFKNINFPGYLQNARSETPVRGSFFNKYASLTPWRPLTMLERDCHTVIFLWILRKF